MVATPKYWRGDGRAARRLTNAFRVQIVSDPASVVVIELVRYRDRLRQALADAEDRSTACRTPALSPSSAVRGPSTDGEAALCSNVPDPGSVEFVLELLSSFLMPVPWQADVEVRDLPLPQCCRAMDGNVLPFFTLSHG